MPDLLLELFSEEIPARMQPQASDDLRRLVTDALVEAGLTYEGAKAFATPRRLALTVSGVTARSADIREERKGPRVVAPEKALEGFLRGAGLSSIDEATVQSDPKKGDFYVAVIEKKGRAAEEIVADVMPGIVRRFPWPKAMRWGAASAPSREGMESLRWVRPLQSILCTFGPETEEPVVIPFEVGSLTAVNVTYGHRFHAPAPIVVRRFEDYVDRLAAAKVVLDPERRRDTIRQDARDLAFAQGLELIEDEVLLAEVAGLVEWPVVLMGAFDEGFLELPPEVIRATIRANQKCFVLRRPDGSLANRFILVANIEASDGGRAVVAGNERVIRARLSDARHFWRTDLGDLPDYADAGKPLDQRLAKLKAQGIVFHEKLGTQGERVERIARLAREIAPLVGADPGLAERAATLAKADLVTEMVGEFPELQGLMGRYYAEAQGEDPSVARAIEEHYKPQGPSDDVPSDPVSIAVALADKLDTLIGFWLLIGEPTSSKDPFALRRTALGVARLVIENSIALPLFDLLPKPFARNALTSLFQAFLADKERIEAIRSGPFAAVVVTPTISELAAIYRHRQIESAEEVSKLTYIQAKALLSFFADRLKIYLRDQGQRHDLIDAVFGLGDQDDLLLIVRRVEALGAFLKTEDGANLLAGVKRATNILRIEEKKDGCSFDGAPDPALFAQDEERVLADAIARAEDDAEKALAAEDFAGAMTALAGLRAPVDAFFDAVTVNADDPALRENRLRLLARIREATAKVADFSKIAG